MKHKEAFYHRRMCSSRHLPRSPRNHYFDIYNLPRWTEANRFTVTLPTHEALFSTFRSGFPDFPGLVHWVANLNIIISYIADQRN